MTSTNKLDASTAAAAPGSHADWIGLALLVSCIVVNDAAFRVADPETVSLDWQNVLRLGISALCGGYGILNLSRAWRVFERFPMAWLLPFVAWAILTLPLAINPRYATAACATLVCSVLLTAAIVARVPGETIVKWLVGAILFLVAGAWIAQFTYPQLGQPEYLTPGHEPSGWRLGGWMHPNALGTHCALGMALVLAGRMAWRWRWTSVLCLAAVLGATLIATGSRTSGLMVVAAIALFAARRYPALLFAAVAGLTGLMLLSEAAGVNWSRFVPLLARDNGWTEIATLTGRTELWRMAVEFIGRSPLWGHGYGCSRFLFLESADFPATHPHNLFLDTAVETGLVGAALETAMLLAMARRLIVRPSPFADMVCVLVLVMGLVEVAVFNPLPEIFTLTWMLALGWQRSDAGFSILDLRVAAPDLTIRNPKSKIQNVPGVA